MRIRNKDKKQETRNTKMRIRNKKHKDENKKQR